MIKTNTVFYTNVRQYLVEKMGDFLDSIRGDEAIEGVTDPKPRELSDLHEKMAAAAMVVYAETMEEL